MSKISIKFCKFNLKLKKKFCIVGIWKKNLYFIFFVVKIKEIGVILIKKVLFKSFWI